MKLNCTVKLYASLKITTNILYKNKISVILNFDTTFARVFIVGVSYIITKFHSRIKIFKKERSLLIAIITHSNVV